MNGKTTTLLWFMLILEIVEHASTTCIFSERLRESRWHTRIKPATSRRTTVKFSNSEMLSEEEDTTSGNVLSTNRRDCIEMVDMGKYLFRYLDDSSLREKYGCMKIVWRGVAIFQLELSELFEDNDRDYCIDTNLKLDHWPFASLSLTSETFVTCPFFGGYNMKVHDSKGVENGCNFMDLPMRIESECIIGEGVVFNFRSEGCVIGMPMDEYQRLVCVTYWEEGGNMISVLRRQGTDELWCLRYDTHKINTDYFSVYLFTDFVCSSDSRSTANYMHYILTLERVIQSNLCADEYIRCEEMTCLPVIRNQCQKSCGACSPKVLIEDCSFPRKLRGDWYLNDKFGSKIVRITENKVSIEDIGLFKCISFDDSPQKEETKFTTVSMFSNGCRPRYTCVNFERLGHSIYGIALSQSETWPLTDPRPGTTVCDASKFRPDSEPISDTYRSAMDSVKPIVPVKRWGKPIDCPLKNIFKIKATLKDESTCNGNMFRDCVNPSLLRIQMSRCRGQLLPLDYLCITNFKGRYWENIIILQNQVDASDVRCLIFTDLQESEAIMLPAAQCDQNSWTFINAGLRTPMIHFEIQPLAAECISVPSPTSVTGQRNGKQSQLLKLTVNNNKTITSPGYGVPADSGYSNEHIAIDNKRESDDKRNVLVSSTKNHNRDILAHILSASYIFCVFTVSIKSVMI